MDGEDDSGNDINVKGQGYGRRFLELSIRHYQGHTVILG